MHGQRSGLDIIPGVLKVCQAALIKHPQQQTDGHVDVISEVPHEVAAAKVVDDVESVASHNKVIPQGARNPFLLHTGLEVLGEPNRQVSLTGQRLVGQHIDQVIEVSVIKPNPAMLGEVRVVCLQNPTLSPASVLRPVAFGVAVVKLGVLLPGPTVGVGGACPGPITPLLAGVQGVTSDSLFLEVVVCPWKVRANRPAVEVQVLSGKLKAKAVVE